MTRKSILAVALGVGLLGPSAVLMAQKNNAAEVLLGQGLHQEEVDNNCREAIKTYQKVTTQRNVPSGVAGRAQFHIGLCQESLGQREARAAYELLVTKYPDQKDLVAQARVRLAFLGGSATPQNAGTSKEFIPLPNLEDGASVSADGRYIAYVDKSQPDGRAVVVRDLRTGQTRPVSPSAAGGNSVGYPVFSPDGRQLVYVWTTAQERELRVINLMEPGVPRFRRLLADRWAQAYSWTPDATSIVVATTHDLKSAEMGIVSVADGSRRRVLKTFEPPGKTWASMSLSPDGKYLAFDNRVSLDAPYDVFLLPLDGGQEIRVVDHPANDRLVGWSPDSKYLLFTSDRNTGTAGLYALAVENGRPQQTRPTLIETDTGTILPMGVTSAGALYYVRSRLDQPDPTRIQEIEIATFDFESGALGTPTLVGADRNGNYTAPAWSRDGKYLAYHAMPTPGLDPYGVFIRSMDTGATRELRLSTPAGSLDWSPDGRYLLSAAPTTGVHLVDVRTGTSSPVSTGDRRRAVWSPDGATVYYYANVNGARRDPAASDGSDAIVAHDMASGKERILIRRGNVGAPVLSPDGRYIATVSVSVDASTKSGPVRSILLIPTGGGEPRTLHRLDLLRDPARDRVAQPLNVLMWAPDSNSVLAIAGEEREIWKLPIEGAPRKLFNDTEGRFGTGPFPVAVHPDGKRVAIVQRSSPSQQSLASGVHVLEHFLPRPASSTR